jgi:DeoR family transcriptional regulator, glycerol-3-phosphate regulon repressor
MTSMEKAKSKAQRHEAILAELRATPAIRIVQLAVLHGVSTETIRRDLDELSAEGLISRTYGGATGTPLSEPLLDDRYRANQDQRAAMSRGVVPLIKDGDTLMVDAGATTIFVARRLAAETKDLSVVTTSFGVASALATNPTIRIRVCPGEYDPRDGGVTGPDAISYLSQFRVNHAVLGASRFDAEGPSDFNSSSVWIKRTMIKQAEQTIMVLGQDKFDKAAFERICGLSDIDHVVTDQPPSEKLARALREAGVTLHVSG